MYICHLPPGTNFVKFPDIPVLIADAIYKNRELHEWQRCKYWANQELTDLARHGLIRLRNPVTLGKLDLDPSIRDFEGVLSYTVMTLDDLKLLMADRHIQVSTGEQFQKLVEELAFVRLDSALSTVLASQADQEAPAHATAPATTPPAPVADNVALDEPLEDRNLRWLNHYETEERITKLGAYNRTAAHFAVKASTLRKAVNKAREQRTERNRAGPKTVTAKREATPFTWPVTTVKDGKKTTKSHR